MSNIVPFIPRAAGGDWTAGERERLAELAGKLTSSGAHVDAAYGVSDAGDPWCVITDDADEVLIHVARIDGQFVIHDAAADAVQAEDTLWSAFERLMGPDWRGAGDDDMVVPLRQAQSVLALVAALLFVSEIAHVADHAPHEDIPDAPHPAAGLEVAALAAPAAHDGIVANAAAQSQTPEDSSPRRQALIAQAAESPVETGSPQAAPTPTPAPASPPALHEPVAPMALAEAAPAVEPGRLLVAGNGGESLIGGAGGDHLVGGTGNDTLVGGGSRPGEIDLLEGGAGDDRIMLGARTVAVGGEGHDVFVVPTLAPEPKVVGPEAGTVATAGIILDFTADDHIEMPATGAIVSVTANVDVLAGLHGFTSLARQPVTPGVTVGIDLDGDGRADTYLFVAGSGSSSLTVTPTKGSSPPEPTDHEMVITLSGATHNAGDPLLG